MEQYFYIITASSCAACTQFRLVMEKDLLDLIKVAFPYLKIINENVSLIGGVPAVREEVAKIIKWYPTFAIYSDKQVYNYNGDIVVYKILDWLKKILNSEQHDDLPSYNDTSNKILSVKKVAKIRYLAESESDDDR